MKTALLLVFAAAFISQVYGFDVATNLLEPEVFQALQEQKQLRNFDAMHFALLQQLLATQFGFAEEVSVSNKGLQAFLGRLITAVGLQKTPQASTTLAKLLQILSCHASSTEPSPEQCLICQRNCEFFMDNIVAIKNLSRLIAFKEGRLRHYVKNIFIILGLAPYAIFSLLGIQEYFWPTENNLFVRYFNFTKPMQSCTSLEQVAQLAGEIQKLEQLAQEKETALIKLVSFAKGLKQRILATENKIAEYAQTIAELQGQVQKEGARVDKLVET
jgi:hypothetical protein